ncbi:hypothetical protein H6F68_05750 [Trichocoleus sp. FACHB-262]|nr:hypothetical protein [Trichocoleus sp. FACHB-262]
MNRRYAADSTSTAIVSDVANFLYADRNRFHDLSAQDIPDAEVQLMAVI